MEKQKEGSEVVRGGGGRGGRGGGGRGGGGGEVMKEAGRVTCNVTHCYNSQTRAGDGGGCGGGGDYSSGGGGDGGGAIPWPRLSSLSLITRERGKIPDGTYTTAER
ncbi:hypothetical protein HZH68_007545 [Vespula germanica]|uniref:Uncharacterized protein n=1 Tax=Vespula germanica TaxID=30212 RepID=A0A834K8A9_VESGE|nr:hypothetical protein HZH68_007545 [Vespula germanica]